MAATVDVVSEGRLEMGIGAGWYEHEWRAYGYGFPSAGERLGMLREGLDIFRQAWTTGSATLDGRYYQVDGALCAPQPLQGGAYPGSSRNRIPIWVAGGGERKTLRIAAEYADYTNFDGTPETFTAKSEILAGHCRDVGRDFDEIVRSANYNVFIGRDQAEVDDRLNWMFEHFLRGGVPEQKAQRQVDWLRRGPLVGTPDQIIETLADLRSRGMRYAICYFAEAAYDTTGIDLFERKVLPELVDRAGQHRAHLGRHRGQ